MLMRNTAHVMLWRQCRGLGWVDMVGDNSTNFQAVYFSTATDVCALALACVYLLVSSVQPEDWTEDLAVSWLMNECSWVAGQINQSHGKSLALISCNAEA